MLYDTHAHLDYPEFTEDFDGVLTRAKAAGVSRMISIGTDLESSRAAIQLAEKYAEVYAVVGWHPTQCMDAPPDLRPALRELVKHPKVVAIGETGMDYYRLPSLQPGAAPDADDRYRARQAEVFQQQLEVAAEAGLNVVIHQRAAWEDTLSYVARYAGRVKTVFHCFSESVAAMQQVLDLGGLVSYTGILTFKNGQGVRDVLAATPVDRFMFETDCPYLAPIPYRGKRCEPAYVRETAMVAAEVRKVSLEELAATTSATAREFFFKMDAPIKG